MIIALDAAGVGREPTPVIDGAVQAATARGVGLVLAGPAERIRAELTARGVSASDPRFEILDAPQELSPGDDPETACRVKPRTAVMLCAELVASGRAAGMVTSAPRAAAIAAAAWHVKRVPGVLRAALAVPVPTPKGVCVVLDAGAAPDAKPWHLAQFAALGSAFSRSCFGVSRPTVGLLCAGDGGEDWGETLKEAAAQLKALGDAYVGPLPARELMTGKADVAVCDAFAGGAVLQAAEGAAAAVVGVLKSELGATWQSRLAALALRGPLSRVGKMTGCGAQTCGVLLGLDGVAVLCRRPDSARAVAEAVASAARYAEAGLVKALHEATTDAAVPQPARI